MTDAERVAEARVMLAKCIVEYRGASIGPSRDVALALVNDAIDAFAAACVAEAFEYLADVYQNCAKQARHSVKMDNSHHWIGKAWDQAAVIAKQQAEKAGGR